MITQEILDKVRRIEIHTHHLVDELTGSAYHSVFKGKGMEFDEVRGYIPGDEVRDIDWNVTARMGHPYIKKFSEERELTVYFLVDLSASGDFGSGNMRKNDLATELTALLAFSAIRNQDKVGLLLFTDRNELRLPPRKGRRHALRLIRELLAFERQGNGTNIAMALETFIRMNPRRSIVFLISDFIDDEFERPMRMVRRRHDLIALHILDKREESVPAIGEIALEDAESGQCIFFPSSGSRERQLFHQHSSLHGDQLQTLCRRLAVDLVTVRSDEDYLKPLVQFFQRRKARAGIR